MKKSLKGIRCLSCFLALACLLSLPGQAENAASTTAQTLKTLTSENIHELSPIIQIGKGVPIDASWSPDGMTIALASGTGVYLFDVNTLAPLALLPSGFTKLVSWSADGQLLAVCVSPRDTIQLWNVPERRLLYSIAQKSTLSAIWINQEKGELVALGQQEAGAGKFNESLYKSYLDTYQLKNGKKKVGASFQSGNKQLMMLDLSPGGKTVFGVGIKEYYIWNFKGKLLYKAPVTLPMGALGVSDGSLVAVLDMMKPKQIQIINMKKKAEAGKITLSAGARRLSLDDTGRKLIVYTTESYQVYDLATQQAERGPDTRACHRRRHAETHPPGDRGTAG
jgi:hypothetical protein